MHNIIRKFVRITAAFLSIPVLVNTVHAQIAPNIQWEKNIGLNRDDKGNSAVLCKDGGFIIGGSTNSTGAGGNDMCLIKTSRYGTTQWVKTFGGSAEDLGECVLQTADGGYLLCGSSRSFSTTGYDVYLVKTDSQGTMQWSKTINHTSFNEVLSVVQTPDGGYGLAGFIYSPTSVRNMLLLKVDSMGDLLWEKEYGNTSRAETCNSLCLTNDGGLLLAGQSDTIIDRQLENPKLFLVKTDSSGNQLWSQTFADQGRMSIARSVKLTVDGGFIVGGITSYGFFASYLLKIDSQGTMEWSKKYASAEYSDFTCTSVMQTSDGGYVGAGTYSIYDFEIPYATGVESRFFSYTTHCTYAFKTDANGVEQWTHFGPLDNAITGSAFITEDDGLVIVGRKFKSRGNYDVFMKKYSPEKPIVVSFGSDSISRNERFTIKLRVNNLKNKNISGTFYTEVIRPDGTRYPSVYGSDTTWHLTWPNVQLYCGQSRSGQATASVPWYFPVGVYTYKSYFKLQGENTIYTDETTFKVVE